MVLGPYKGGYLKSIGTSIIVPALFCSVNIFGMGGRTLSLLLEISVCLGRHTESYEILE